MTSPEDPRRADPQPGDAPSERPATPDEAPTTPQQPAAAQEPTPADPQRTAAAQQPPAPAGPAPAGARQPSRFREFVGHRATQLVAAGLAGLLIGGGAVALFDHDGGRGHHGRAAFERHGPRGGPGFDRWPGRPQPPAAPAAPTAPAAPAPSTTAPASPVPTR